MPAPPAPPAHAFSEYLTVRKAARYLGVSINTLRAWDEAGKLVATRHPMNGYRLYERAGLDQMLLAVHRGPPQ